MPAKLVSFLSTSLIPLCFFFFKKKLLPGRQQILAPNPLWNNLPSHNFIAMNYFVNDEQKCLQWSGAPEAGH